MKKFLLLCILATSLLFSACSKDDDNKATPLYPKTVNIKFEVSTTSNPDAIISMTINNDTEVKEDESLPFSFSYTQQEVNEGTYLKLTYEDNSDAQSGSTWENYNTDLSIFVDGELVRQVGRVITEGLGPIKIEYTFE